MGYENNFIKLSRTLLEWQWYTNLNVKSAFIHCLLSANWKDKSWQGMTVERGSFITTIKAFSEGVGLTEQEVRTAWKKLETSQEITKKSTNGFTKITVNNWDKYQTELERATNQQQTTNKQLTTTKEYKETKDRMIDRKIINNNSDKELCETLGFYTLSSRQCSVIRKEWMKVKSLAELADIVERAKEHNPKNLFAYVQSIITKSSYEDNFPKIKIIDYPWWEDD